MSKQNKVPDFSQLRKTLLDDVRIIAETEGLNHFQESFTKGGFTDATFQAWQPRGGNVGAGRSILTSSGALRDALHIASSSKNHIVFANDMPYAKIHNEGGTIKVPITAKSRKYFWYMYKQTGVAMWKGMALSKKEHISIKIPQRQFMGDSVVLMQTMQNQVFDHIKNELTKAFKNT